MSYQMSLVLIGVFDLLQTNETPLHFAARGSIDVLKAILAERPDTSAANNVRLRDCFFV